jgi:hypothetical protein
MASFSVENFRETVLNLGLARKNRFEVLISAPAKVSALGSNQDRIISLMAESAVLPELTINAEMQQIWGPAIHRPKSIGYGGFMVLQFHLDQSMAVKKLFDSWMESIVDGSQYTVSYQSDYVAPLLQVVQLNDIDEPVYTVNFEDAFPAGQTQLDLNHGLQNATHLLQVNFRFRRWYAENTNQGAFTQDNPADKQLIRKPASTAFRLLDPNTGIPIRSR